MYHNGEIFDLNATQRVVIEYDEYTESPLSWGYGNELHEIDNYRIWREWDTPDDEFAAVISEIYYKFGRNKDVALRAARILLSILGDERTVEIHEFRGHTQSDWATYVELYEAGNGSIFPEYEAWRLGEVYTVQLQETELPATVEVHVGDDGKFYTDEPELYWEPVDSIGGCYLTDEYTPVTVAKEYFEIKESK